MNEKTKTNLYRISLVVIGLWAISASVAAGIFYHGRNTARTELAEIRTANPGIILQSDLDALYANNVQLIAINEALSSELEYARTSTTELSFIIDRATGLAESGRQSLLDTRQSITGITNTVEQLRNNYQQLTDFVVRSESNYNAIIDELNKGSNVGGTDGTETSRK